MSEFAPGFYPDPSGNPQKLRYWDGQGWTDQYADAQPQQPQNGYAQNQYYNPQAGAAPQYDRVDYVQVNVMPEDQEFLKPGAIYPMSSKDSILRLIAFILNLLTCIGACWLLIPLAWCIPMTVYSWRLYKGTRPNSTAFAVCTLIFVDIISGILLLISKKEK